MKSSKNGALPDSASVETATEAVDEKGWVLPSGMRLEEFAVAGGFLAPLLLKTTNAPLKKWNAKRG